MSMSKDEFVTCPYDNSHRVLRIRLPIHLERCRKHHPKGKMMTCPYNITHVINKCEFEFHISICSSKVTMDKMQCLRNKSLLPEAPRPQLTDEDCEENWDDQPDVPTYKPHDYCKNNLIVREIKGAPPAVRKEFRKHERLRFLDLQN